MKSITRLVPVLALLTVAMAARRPAPGGAACAAAEARFQTTCVRCHGSGGRGYAAIHTPDFTDPNWQAAHPDSELIAAVTHGKNGMMPSFQASLTPAQTRALVLCAVRGFASGRKTPVAPPSRPAPTTSAAVSGAPVRLGHAGVYTEHNNNQRTGANLRETVLTPANVNSRRFGLLFRHAVDDQIFGQPLYVPRLKIAGGLHDVVYVTTAADSVYAFDADRGAAAPYWQVKLGQPAGIRDYHFGCPDILGNMGIIGTPVIDRFTRTLYVVALTKEHGAFVQRLHALDLATGAERAGSPVVITAPAFNPILQNQRPALLLSRGEVYVAYASHCDDYVYHGFVMSYDARTLRQRAVFNTSPTARGASIWQSGQGPAADAAGNLYFVTSNGVWDGQRNFSESFLKLSPRLRLLDWFTPGNHEALDRRDADLNSSGAMLIPGTQRVIGAGKKGVLYMINTAHMGHLGDAQAVQEFPATTAEVNLGAVYWQSAREGALVFVWGQNDALKAYRFIHGHFETAPMAASPQTSAYPGGILSLSANGTRDGIVWANAAAAPKGNAHVPAPGILRAYAASDVAHELWDSAQDPARDSCGNISKNSPPTVVNGHVYLASFGNHRTGSGELCVYGLRP